MKNGNGIRRGSLKTASILSICLAAGCAETTPPVETNLAMPKMTSDSIKREIARGGPRTRIAGGPWEVKKSYGVVESSVPILDGEARLAILSSEAFVGAKPKYFIETGVTTCNFADPDDVGLPLATIAYVDGRHIPARASIPREGGRIDLAMAQVDEFRWTFTNANHLRIVMKDKYCGREFGFEFDISGEPHTRAQRVRQLERELQTRGR